MTQGAASGGEDRTATGGSGAPAPAVPSGPDPPPSPGPAPDSHALLAAIAETVPGLVYSFRLDAEGHATMPYASPAIERIYGLSLAEAARDFGVFFQRVHPDDQAGFLASIAESARALSPWQAEFRFLHATRGEVWVEANSLPRREAGGGTVWTGYAQDVTSRKNADRAIRDSEERYRAVVEATSDWVWETDAEGRFSYASGRLEEVLGYSPEEMLGRSPFELMPAEEARRVAEEFAGIAAERRPFRGLVNLNLHKDGHEVVLETSGVPVFGPGREFRGYRGVDRDVTERRLAEQAIAEERTRLRTLIDSIPDLVWLKDPGGVYIAANPVFERLMDVPPGGLLGKTDADLFPPEAAGVFREEDLAVLETGRARAYEEWSTFPKSPRRTLFAKVKTPMRDADGTLVGVLGIGRDITDMRRTESDLKTREAIYSSVVDQAFDSVAIVDPESGAFAEFNAAAHLSLGYSAEEFAALRVMDVDVGLAAEELPALFTTMLRPGGAVTETRHRRSDGTMRHVRVSGRPIELDGRPHVASIWTDITDQKAVEDEIRKLNLSLERRVRERTTELEGANRELESFAYAVSHDLRAPLRALNGFSQMLVRDFGEGLPETARAHLLRIRDASSRMSALVDGLLSLSRTAGGELRRETVDLSVLAEAALGELAAAEPGRLVAWSIEPGLVVSGDAPMLDAVLRNLLSNAWKYTGKTPAARIRVHGGRRDGRDHVSVEDNGAGFDMAHASRLFQPFQRLHRDDEFPGIGIGLATVQRIVRRHGGTLTFEASPGRGATFRFSLPAGS